jgi:peptide/nickel transport system substrate-binding protein
MQFSNAMVVPSLFKGYLYVAWNQLRKQGETDVKTPFADPRVRRAMTMLLDRQRMTKEIFLGYFTVADGPFGPNNPQSDPSVEPWPHDEKAAKALLAEAGFKDANGDGVTDGPDGKPFRFTLTYPSGSETWEKVVLFMKDAYARAGITMEPDRVDWPVLVQKLNQSNFDAVTLGWSRTPESDPYQIFHSASIADQGDNRIAYRNSELDKAIEQARTTVDKEARMKLWHKVHRILHEDQPYTFLFDRPELRLFHNRIQNVQPSPIGLNFELLNGPGVIPWYVPQGRQRYTQ